MKTRAWWVCNCCEQPLIRVGKGGLREAFETHRKGSKECAHAGGQIKQVTK